MARSKLIEAGTAAGGTVVTLIHEIGTDGLFALLRVLEGEAREKAEAYYRALPGRRPGRGRGPDRREGRPLQAARTSRPTPTSTCGSWTAATRASSCGAPSATPPAAPTATRSSSSPPGPWAPTTPTTPCPSPCPPTPRACRSTCRATAAAAAATTPSTTRCPPSTSCSRPSRSSTTCSCRGSGSSSARSPRRPAPLALTFVEYHRFTAVSYKLPLVDAFVGAAAQIAEMNGVMKAGHIRDKLTHLVAYAETVRALTEAAALRSRIGEHGIAYPDPMTTNMAKYTFASGFYKAVEWLQDIAGGLLVTGPSGADWDSPRDPAGPGEVLRRRRPRPRAPGHDEPHLGPHRPGPRRLPRRARRPRRGLARGREAPDAPQLHRQPRPGAIAYARKLAGLD